MNWKYSLRKDQLKEPKLSPKMSYKVVDIFGTPSRKQEKRAHEIFRLKDSKMLKF